MDVRSDRSGADPFGASFLRRVARAALPRGQLRSSYVHVQRRVVVAGRGTAAFLPGRGEALGAEPVAQQPLIVRRVDARRDGFDFQMSLFRFQVSLVAVSRDFKGVYFLLIVSDVLVCYTPRGPFRPPCCAEN